MTATVTSTTTSVPTSPASAVTGSRDTLPFAIVAVSSVLAGLIHYAVVPEHRSEWVVYAVFFTLLGAFQLIWAATVWIARRRPVLIVGALVNAVAIGLWIVTRTVGLPFGPEAGEAEAAGVIDVLCVLAEAVVLVTAVAALWVSTRRRAT